MQHTSTGRAGKAVHASKQARIGCQTLLAVLEQESCTIVDFTLTYMVCQQKKQSHTKIMYFNKGSTDLSQPLKHCA